MTKLKDAILATCRTPRLALLWISILITAVRTGLRRGELLQIVWSDINFERRTLNIRAEINKTDRSRLLPLDRGLTFHLWLYYTRLPAKRMSLESGLFPLSDTAVEQRWTRLCRTANIKDLHFHDLRRTAGVYFDADRELTVSEHEYMMGHDEGTTNSIYRIGEVNRIRTKLDKGFEAIDIPKTDEQLEERIEFVFNSSYDDYEEFLKAKKSAKPDPEMENAKAEYLRIFPP
jgi:integrase